MVKRSFIGCSLLFLITVALVEGGLRLFDPWGAERFYAVDTVASIPAFRGTVPVETTQRKKLFTCAAKFGRGIHSASLSLYLIMLPAGGEIDRFSGATLADMPIIPQVAYV